MKVGSVRRGIFLALRMFVNDELNEFKFALAFAQKVLKKGTEPCLKLISVTSWRFTVEKLAFFNITGMSLFFPKNSQ
jgi:16S rRNA C1402 N4-methylase RsmH